MTGSSSQHHLLPRDLPPVYCRVSIAFIVSQLPQINSLWHVTAQYISHHWRLGSGSIHLILSAFQWTRGMNISPTGLSTMSDKLVLWTCKAAVQWAGQTVTVFSTRMIGSRQALHSWSEAKVRQMSGLFGLPALEFPYLLHVSKRHFGLQCLNWVIWNQARREQSSASNGQTCS